MDNDVGLTMSERQAVTRQMAARYGKAGKGQKGEVLTELCALTGWSRRHARRALTRAAHSRKSAARPRRPHPVRYGPEMKEPLTKVWAIMGTPCGKRMAPFMEEIVAALIRHGELTLSDNVRGKLLAISAATIDRLLAPERKQLSLTGRSHTKPGSLLKSQIPIRTFAEWDEDIPGFCEGDLVAHDGGNASGDYCHTLTMTDVASGWTETGAMLNKAHRHVFAAVKKLRRQLPFPLRGFDSDNGGEFINHVLFEYCTQEEITFTRSRPYRKNDNCFVEQKNWSVVRTQVGYARYDTQEECDVLNDLYGHLRLMTNFFTPQMKLLAKTRTGSKVTKKYDAARTPCQRLLDSPDIPTTTKKELRRLFHSLNPAQLQRDIAHCRDRLTKLATEKHQSPRPYAPPPNHPGRTFRLSQRPTPSRTF